MIKSIDLKIKNLVHADFGGKQKDLREVVISGINERGTVYCRGTEDLMRGLIYEHYNEHLYGIPLTTEWLERMGFEIYIDEEYSETDGYYFKTFPYIDDLVSELDKDGIFHVHDCQDEKMKFYFVHEIQNIHYALHREELIIKPLTP